MIHTFIIVFYILIGHLISVDHETVQHRNKTYNILVCKKKK